jgi:hypothetical protein
MLEMRPTRMNDRSVAPASLRSRRIVEIEKNLIWPPSHKAVKGLSVFQ